RSIVDDHALRQGLEEGGLDAGVLYPHREGDERGLGQRATGDRDLVAGRFGEVDRQVTWGWSTEAFR
ncbi:hypothetical protein, partial [Acidithiobacillus sp.]|uniref:hypothetical protein n=1 Tax=Acidithiobacillus sp. TaxID=1872118 RepID=UPI003567D494